MSSGKTFQIRIDYLKKCSGAAELTVRVHRYNYEPMIVDIRACTFCGEDFLFDASYGEHFAAQGHLAGHGYAITHFALGE